MAHRFSSKSAALTASLTCLLTAAAPSAHAQEVAWVLDDQPNAGGEYVPASQYSFNSATTPSKNYVLKNGAPGSYRVVFPNLGLNTANGGPFNAQISGYNMSGWCVLEGFGANSSEATASVQCYNGDGQRANESFTVLYQARSAPFGTAKQGIAFLYTAAPAQAGSSYTPTVTYNSTGGANTVKVNKTGNYTVTLGGLTQPGGDVQVVTNGSKTQCKAASWNASSAGKSVTVQCYSFAGVPAFAAFDLAYAIGEPFGLVTGASTRGAWAWADALNDGSAYTPTTTYQYNGFNTGHLTVHRTGTGLYTVTIPGTVSYKSSVALVTAVGANAVHCNVAGWAGATINVGCYAHGGVPTNSQFDVTLQTFNN